MLPSIAALVGLLSLSLSLLAVQPVESITTVHLVPHTHDDVGWLKTVDQYFVGANNTIQHAGVQYILDSVIAALQANPDRKFIYVEQAFFHRWYVQQTSLTQSITKSLVASGQLEFINGGWCMHDEAATLYVDMIDQTTLGHRFIQSEFEVQPKVGWQIDPFGHSATQAALLSAEVGFESLYFARIDYQDHDFRSKNKNLEFLWQASPSLGPEASVFTGVFTNGYGEDGLCFDSNQCDNAMPVVDDPRLEDNNVQDLVDRFVQAAENMQAVTLGNDVMFKMGSDFEYENANEWFKNLDKLIHYVNLDGRIKAQYSTPSIYTAAKQAAGLNFTTKYDDFFPYSDGPHTYWTGYFTSRPALKRYVRTSSAFLQLARQFEIWANEDGSATQLLWQAIGVAQHHDAVSGTSKQHVAFDYAKAIRQAERVTEAFVNNVLGILVTPPNAGVVDFHSCPLLNISLCEISSSPDAPNLIVVTYNPLARSRTELVRVPIGIPRAFVWDSTGNLIPSQVINVLQTPALHAKSAAYEVEFQATIPGLGFQTYFVTNTTSATPSDSTTDISELAHPHHTFATLSNKPHSGNSESKKANVIRRMHTPSSSPVMISETIDEENANNNVLTIENDAVSVSFDASTGLITTVTDKFTGVQSAFSQTFGYYQSYGQVNTYQNGNSGAYISRFQNENQIYPITTQPISLNIVSGPIDQVVQQIISPWLNQTIRLTDDGIEFEFTVGSIPIDDGIGKEIITQYTTDIKSNGVFYTDSNGRELQQRIRNYRPTWTWNPTEPVVGNYYPVNALISLNDTSRALSVLVDRSQGGTSMNDGQIEVMIHRRTLADDARGVGEPLNETEAITSYANTVCAACRLGQGLVITGKHRVILTSASTASARVRPLQQRFYQPVHLSLARFDGNVTHYLAYHTPTWSQLGTSLPKNVELLTLQALDENTRLIRLAHTFGVGEDATYSQTASVDLSTLFKTITIAKITEVSLTTNQIKSEMKRMPWNGAAQQPPKEPFAGTVVTLSPLQIRTFEVTFA